MRRAQRVGVVVVDLEEEALEVGRHLNIHGGRRGRHHLARLVAAGGERAGEDVVDVGGDHQTIERRARPRRGVTGVDVAEVAGGHHEGDVTAAERGLRREVIDHLRHDARPVDGVDGGEPHPVAEGVVVEQRLHDRLAVVECAVDSDRMHIRLGCAGHHAPLHVGHAARGEQHHEIGAVAAAEGLDRRTAGVAGGGDENGHPLAAGAEHVVHEAGEELHGHVLEGERGAMEKLEQMLVRRKLHERRHARVIEGAVALAQDALELVVGNGTGDERLDHVEGDVGIRPVRRLHGELRPGLRHIEPAVAREPGKGRVDEVDRRRLAAGGDVTHGFLRKRGTLGAGPKRGKHSAAAGAAAAERRRRTRRPAPAPAQTK